MGRKAATAVLEPEDDEIEQEVATPAVEEKPAPVEPPEVSVMIELPTRELADECYRPRFIEVPSLSKDQRDAMKALFEGLIRKQARLDNGKYVKSPPDAIRWVLEEIRRGQKA